MTIVDAWVTIWDEATALHFAADPKLAQVQRFFAKDQAAGESDASALLGAMDDCGVDLALVSGPLADTRFAGSQDGTVMRACQDHPGRLRAALQVDPLRSLRRTCDAIEAAAADPLVAAVRVLPMLTGEPIASRTYYPIYERCEGLRLPVTINVGVPGPAFRARNQDPLDLDDVCIDFPDLIVIAAHMGHPWEALIVRLMMKYEHLYLSTSAYLARYFDPAIVRYMNSSRGQHKLIFASDDPLLPMGRALADAQALAISDDAKTNFLGENALHVLRLAEAPTDRTTAIA